MISVTFAVFRLRCSVVLPLLCSILFVLSPTQSRTDFFCHVFQNNKNSSSVDTAGLGDGQVQVQGVYRHHACPPPTEAARVESRKNENRINFLFIILPDMDLLLLAVTVHRGRLGIRQRINLPNHILISTKPL